MKTLTLFSIVLLLSGCATYEYHAYPGEQLPYEETASFKIIGDTAILYAVNGDKKYKTKSGRTTIGHLPPGHATFKLAAQTSLSNTTWRHDCGTIRFELKKGWDYWIVPTFSGLPVHTAKCVVNIRGKNRASRQSHADLIKFEVVSKM